MSDNEDLLGDDLGDHSLADYNLGNDEEDQLLADDYEGGSTQNVPTSIESFREPGDNMVPSDYSGHGMEYGSQPIPYQPLMENECVVPNIVVEVPNLPPAHMSYAPYEPRHYEPEHSVPAAMPAVPIESPQIVPSEIVATLPSDMARERFISERPVGAQRLPQVRDIPDSLDKVVVSGALGGGGRRAWRSSPYCPRRAPRAPRGNFPQRNSFPPPSAMRPLPPPPAPAMPDRPLQQPQIQIRLDMPQERNVEMPQPFQPNRPMEMPRPQMTMPRPPMSMPRPQMSMPRPPMEVPRPPPPMEMSRPPYQQFQRFPFREEQPAFNQMRPQFERPMYYPRQQFQRFGPPMPQVTIRQSMPQKTEPEIRMLPVPLPAGLPPGLPPGLPGKLTGKKVLINPHFKGNFQPPVEGLSMPAYIPTRIQKSPPLSPTLEIKFGPIKDIDDAAERFIAEQRSALARAAGRGFVRRSPQRYIENTTIEIANELARRDGDAELLRRQEEFIHANRAGLRRRMRSPSPPLGARRSPSPAVPRREPERRRRPSDEDSEYKRRVREQENIRERVLRAKEVRRRKNAALYIKQMQNREKDDRDKLQKDFKEAPKPSDKPVIDKPERVIDQPSIDKIIDKPASEDDTKPDTTRKTPERDWTPELDTTREKSPVKNDDEVNSTCEELTPPPPAPRAASPPLASDDELELILGDIDGILSDDEDILTKREEILKPTKPDPPKPKPVSDLRAKLPPKNADVKKPPRQKITFTEEREEKKKKEKSPGAPRRALVSSSKAEEGAKRKAGKNKPKHELASKRSRQRIIFDNNLAKLDTDKAEKSETAPAFSNRRVIIQRKPSKDTKSVFSRIEITNDPSKPNPGIFSRAVRTIGERERVDKESNRIVIKNEPEIEYDSSSDDEELLNEDVGNVAVVDNLPHGMTDTRLKTLAGDVQSLILDKEERSAKITFRSVPAAETFKKKFNNKMVAASRLTVTLQ